MRADQLRIRGDGQRHIVDRLRECAGMGMERVEIGGLQLHEEAREMTTSETGEMREIFAITVPENKTENYACGSKQMLLDGMRQRIVG